MMTSDAYKAVVLFAGAALLLLIGGAIVLLSLEKTVPDWFQALALADLTGLLGLVASPKQAGVQINQPPDQPVPVQEVP
jgi:hypothetical protein